MSERGVMPELTDEPTWMIDPVDGTTNFVHGFPFVCVCIGLCVEKKVRTDGTAPRRGGIDSSAFPHGWRGPL